MVWGMKRRVILRYSRLRNRAAWMFHIVTDISFSVLGSTNDDFIYKFSNALIRSSICVIICWTIVQQCYSNACKHPRGHFRGTYTRQYSLCGNGRCALLSLSLFPLTCDAHMSFMWIFYCVTLSLTNFFPAFIATFALQ